MSNVRHLIGQTINRAMHLALRNLPMTRVFPQGVSVFYDIQRIAGQREIGPMFDVGANVGQTAWGLTRYFPGSPLYCFEPVSATFDQLRRNYGGRATCVQMALGSERTTQEIATFADSELNSFCEVRSSAISLGSEIVTIDTVDQFCAEHAIPHLGLLKLDVQGWEMEALKGARQMIQAGEIRFIFAEVGFRARDKDMQPFAELNDFLDDAGYEFCGLYDNFRWGQSKGFVGFANALYALPA